MIACYIFGPLYSFDSRRRACDHSSFQVVERTTDGIKYQNKLNPLSIRRKRPLSISSVI